MKINELFRKNNKNKIKETTSSGSTGSGNIASVSMPLGGIIKRMPPGQSFFYPTAAPKKAKKRNKRR